MRNIVEWKDMLNRTQIKKMKPILKRYGVTSVYIFGSRTRSDYRKDSDLDLLISYRKPMGLIRFVALQQDLSDSLKVKVDLVSKRGLSPYFAPYILRSAKKVL